MSQSVVNKPINTRGIAGLNASVGDISKDSDTVSIIYCPNGNAARMETTFDGDETLTTMNASDTTVAVADSRTSFESGGEAPADPMHLEPMPPLMLPRLSGATSSAYYKAVIDATGAQSHHGYASDGDALTAPLADLNSCDVTGGYLSEQDGISRYARQMQVGCDYD